MLKKKTITTSQPKTLLDDVPNFFGAKIQQKSTIFSQVFAPFVGVKKAKSPLSIGTIWGGTGTLWQVSELGLCSLAAVCVFSPIEKGWMASQKENNLSTIPPEK